MGVRRAKVRRYCLVPESLIAWCSHAHGELQGNPRYVELVDALPMNASGKVTKFVLRERALARHLPGGTA